ncbi:LysR family transcriptional regulator, partial [Paenibacillus polymyxa]|nr:LysR family transcriptional regulator [Paenibacillus polymyxa]
MQRRSLPLSALRAFEAAARLGSFKAAAEELAVTPTAGSHQIRALEAGTGLALFDRQVRKVTLTDT